LRGGFAGDGGGLFALAASLVIAGAIGAALGGDGSAVTDAVV
jgi:hypothetical protein